MRTCVLLFTVAICLSVASPALAQFRFGLQGGFSASKMVGDDVVSSDSNFGTFLGLALEYDLSMDWQLDLEAVLHQKGGDKVVGPRGNAFDLRVDYFELPLTISRHFWLDDGPWSVSPFAGFSVGLNLKCAYREPAGDRALEFEDCADIGLEVPGTAYGVPLGVALRRRYAGGSVFNVEARYTVALGTSVSTGELDGTSQGFSIIMSFLFPGDKKGYGWPGGPNPNR